MKNPFATTAVLVVAIAGATAALGADPDKLARGKYLVTVAGCNDCHTPWKMEIGRAHV